MMKYLYIAVLSLVAISCGTEDANVVVDDAAVVLAYLQADSPIDSIRVTKAIPYLEDSSLETIDDLTILISTEEEEILLESIGNGYYRNLDHIVEQEKAYTLSFEYGSKVVYAETYIKSSVAVSLSRTEIDLEKIEFVAGGPGGPGGPGQITDTEVVDISWVNENSDYFYVVIENIEEEPEYVDAFFEEAINDEDRPLRVFRTEPEIMNMYSINSRRELQTYGTYEIVVYRLNTEYAALYNSVGSSTLSIEEPPSNITNGLGIFTGVTAHTLYLEVGKL